MGIFDNIYKSLTEDECVQTPLMHGIGSGTAAAMLYFVGTGKALMSYRVFIFVTIPVSFVSSGWCQYDQRMRQVKASHFRNFAKYKALTEGTELDIDYMKNKKRSEE